MRVEIVEMIGQIEAAYREAEGVLRIDLKIFRDARVHREEVREAFIVRLQLQGS